MLDLVLGVVLGGDIDGRGVLKRAVEREIEQREADRAEREQLQRVTRETERQARDAYLGVLSEISRVKALQQAVASSRTALEATEAGFDRLLPILTSINPREIVLPE